MKRRKQQHGQTAVDYTLMFAVFVAVSLTVAHYYRGALGNKFRETADQISQGQFDPKRGEFDVTNTSNVVRTEAVTSSGITTSTIQKEKSHRALDVDNPTPTAGDKLFDAKW